MKLKGRIVLILTFTASFLMRCISDTPHSEITKEIRITEPENSIKDFSVLLEPTPLSIDEYIEWYSSHAEVLSLYSDTLGYSYGVSFVPNEMEAIGLAKTLHLPNTSLDSLLALKRRYVYFILSITSNGSSSSQDLKEVASSSYSHLEIQKDFSLIVDKDTLPCVVFQPLMANSKKGEEIIYQVAFEKSTKLENVTFFYNDRLLGAGKREFKFKNIQALPRLKIEFNKG